MVAISSSGSGEGPGWATGPGYSTTCKGSERAWKSWNVFCGEGFPTMSVGPHEASDPMRTPCIVRNAGAYDFPPREANRPNKAVLWSGFAARRAAERWRGRSCSAKSVMARSTSRAKSSGGAAAARHWK